MADRGTWKVVIGATTVFDYTNSILAQVRSTAMPIIQKDNILGAAVSQNRQKGNLEAVAEFRFLKEQASDGDAHNFWMTAARTYNGVRTVALSHKDYASAETTWTLTGVQVEIIVDPVLGPTNTGTITLTGGILS